MRLKMNQKMCTGLEDMADWNTDMVRLRFVTTLRSLINVQSLIIVQGVTLFYKKFKISSGNRLFPFPKMSKFSHLEMYLVVLQQLTGL